jgi:hypothetical protein
MRCRSALLIATLVANSCTPAVATETIVRRSVTKAVTHTTIVRETRRTLHRRRFHEPRFAVYVDPCVRGYLTHPIIYNAPLSLCPEAFCVRALPAYEVAFRASVPVCDSSLAYCAERRWLW